jgi:hypothetical protein
MSSRRRFLSLIPPPTAATAVPAAAGVFEAVLAAFADFSTESTLALAAIAMWSPFCVTKTE